MLGVVNVVFAPYKNKPLSSRHGLFMRREKRREEKRREEKNSFTTFHLDAPTDVLKSFK